MVALRRDHMEILDLEPGDLHLRGRVSVLNQLDAGVLGVDL